MIGILLLALGFFLLVRSSDWLVDGSTHIAKRFGVSELVIGLTIVAFGTSAPEFVVSLIAAFSGSSDLSVGNIVGSNIANILLILGVTAVIYPLHVKRSTTWKEIPFSLLAVLILGVMAFDRIDTGVASFLWSDGFILLSFFAIFLVYMFEMILDGEKKHIDAVIDDKVKNNRIAILMTVGGLVGLALGGQAVVSGAVMLAKLFGLSERVIGLTVVAIGTSLPELATSVTAALKKKADIAVGNVVGSNIFNIFWILGFTTLVHPITVPGDIFGDILVAVGATVLLFLFTFVGKRRRIDRVEGALLVASYFGYLGYLLIAR